MRDFDYGMVQGGAILTISFLLLALVPVAGPFVLILTPLPMIYYRFRLGRISWLKVLALSLLAAYGTLNLIGHPPNFTVLLMIGFTGLLLAEVLARHYSVEKTVLLTAATLFFGTTGFVLYQALHAGMTPWQMVENHVSGMIADNLELYAQMNISGEQIRMIRENAPQLAMFITGIFPALSLSGIVLIVWANLLAGRRLFQTANIGFPDFGDLTAWKAPERLVWILITAGGMLFVPLQGFTVIGMNLLILCGLVYLFQGLAITAFFFRQKQIPKLFRLFFYGLILVQQYMLVVLIGLGLFDLWVDFRTRITPKGKETTSNP